MEEDGKPPSRDNWDYTRHAFWLVAVIMVADLVLASVPIVGCTIMGLDTTIYSGEARCNESRKDVKEILLQLLSVALALLGAGGRGRKD